MKHNMPEANSYDIDKSFQEQLNAVFQSNIKLNGALKEAENTTTLIDNVDMMLVKEQVHMDWMKYQKSMKDGLKMIVNANSLEEQRKHFDGYNTRLYQSIKAFGIGHQTFYQYCPLAIKNEGA